MENTPSEKIIPTGDYTLEMNFSGKYDPSFLGLYKTIYEGRTYVFSQLESIYGRRVFPCFDEPGFKVPFSITLTVPRDQVAVSNTQETSRKDISSSQVQIEFAQTLPLPTYLLAFAVGPFDVVEADPISPNEIRKTPVPLRGLSPAGKGKQLAFALDAGKHFVKILEEYTGVAYPFDKLDLIAAPEFAYGAMENAGAIIFRDTAVLIDEKTAKVSQRKRVASIEAHELAHQWFGDWVTPAWWDDIWLNESFATWMESKVVQAWNPKYEPEIDELIDLQSAFHTDMLSSTRKIRQPVSSHDDIESSLDGITYQKGARVLAMFEKWVTKPVFQKGIQAYMKRFALKNATAREFLESMAATTGQSIDKALPTFLDQPGLPIVNAELECKDNHSKLVLNQSRFFGKENAITDASNTPWKIPVCARYETKGKISESCILLEQPQGTLDLESATCPDWVSLNPDGKGYYLWNMGTKEWSNLFEKGYSKLSVEDRTQISQSLLTAFEHGDVTDPRFFKWLEHIAQDDHFGPVSLSIVFLNKVRNLWLSPKEVSAFEKYSQKVYRTTFDKHEKLWKNSKFISDGDLELKTNLYFALALLGHDSKIRQELVQKAIQFMDTPKGEIPNLEAIEPDLRSLAMRVAVQEKGKPFFQIIQEKLEVVKDNDLRREMIRAMGSSLNPELSEMALHYSLTKSLGRQESVQIPSSQFYFLESRELTWAWYTKNFSFFLEKIPENWQSMVIEMTESLCDSSKIDELQNLINPRLPNILGGSLSLKNTLEQIQICSAQRNGPPGKLMMNYFGNVKR